MTLLIGCAFGFTFCLGLIIGRWSRRPSKTVDNAVQPTHPPKLELIDLKRTGTE